jgi:hypothetical protein
MSRIHATGLLHWPHDITAAKIRFARVLLIEVGGRSPVCYHRPMRRSGRVRDFSSVAPSVNRPTQQARVAVGQHHRMMRGLVHGIVLSLAIWLAAGYLTFILR